MDASAADAAHKSDSAAAASEPSATSTTPAVPAALNIDIGTVKVTSNPDGADVYVDGQFYGDSPATLKLKPGKHTIGVRMAGYKNWSRDIATDAGSEAHLSATLEKAE